MRRWRKGSFPVGLSDAFCRQIVRTPARLVPRGRLGDVGTLTGRVHRSTIDAVPSAPFEGKRVRVVLELVDDDLVVARNERGDGFDERFE